MKELAIISEHLGPAQPDLSRGLHWPTKEGHVTRKLGWRITKPLHELTISLSLSFSTVLFKQAVNFAIAAQPHLTHTHASPVSMANSASLANCAPLGNA